MRAPLCECRCMPHWCIKEVEVFTSVGVAAIFYRLWSAVSCFSFLVFSQALVVIFVHIKAPRFFASKFATYPRETIICVTFVVMLIVIEIYCRHPLLKHFPEPAWGTKLLLCSIFMVTWQRQSHTQLLRRSQFQFCVSIMFRTFKFKFHNNSSLCIIEFVVVGCCG